MSAWSVVPQSANPTRGNGSGNVLQPSLLKTRCPELVNAPPRGAREVEPGLCFKSLFGTRIEGLGFKALFLPNFGEE